MLEISGKPYDAFAGAVDEPEHRLEKGIVVPGVRDRLLVFQQQLYLLLVGRRAGFLEHIAVIVQVHDENPVEPVEIFGGELPAAKPGDVDPVLFRYGNGAAVGRVAHMPVAGAGGIYVPIQSFLARQVAEDAFGKRGPANITKADHQYLHVRSIDRELLVINDLM